MRGTANKYKFGTKAQNNITPISKFPQFSLIPGIKTLDKRV